MMEAFENRSSPVQEQQQQRKRPKMSVAETKKYVKSMEFYDKTGDIEILTSNEVLCKTHSHYLQTSS